MVLGLIFGAGVIAELAWMTGFLPAFGIATVSQGNLLHDAYAGVDVTGTLQTKMKDYGLYDPVSSAEGAFRATLRQ